ncbi:condensin complex protein MksE [Sphingobacterium siyangense]|uniref:condensin complex protein MksE n=1 Tax=Sphingobacterium siyangense TaxID=459529 RepID=UPI0019642C3E|nr:hypothetical protein [Sphingobacterium siyangense]QRY55856.1 hypothetical protein JVX97_17705 [Sphingobacterium siyangense]
MDNKDNDVISYAFLAKENIEKHFADINLKLLSGRHIDERDYLAFNLIEDNLEHWKTFYGRLYRLDLVSGNFDGQFCFYLNFFDDSKGLFLDYSRHRVISSTQTLIGLMLIDIYYKRFFDEHKIVKWSDLRNTILEGELQHSYKKVLFGEVRESNSYDAREWGNVYRKFNKTIDLFDKIGWVEKLSGTGTTEVQSFELRPAINRLAKMYDKELENFDIFVSQLKMKSKTKMNNDDES